MRACVCVRARVRAAACAHVCVGVKYVSRISPFFLIFVLLSVLAILIGLFRADASIVYPATCAAATACGVSSAAPGATDAGSGASPRDWG